MIFRPLFLDDSGLSDFEIALHGPFMLISAIVGLDGGRDGSDSYD